MLGVPPMLGRTFLTEEEDAGRDRVVVLSHGLWTRRYGADPAIVGKTIQIDGKTHVVVGVMPASFVFEFGGRASCGCRSAGPKAIAIARRTRSSRSAG